MTEEGQVKVLLSIVVANYNYGRFLQEAFDSVFRQCAAPVSVDGRMVLPILGSNVAVELIVCDAASTDNSCEVIRANADKIAWWCSEKDGGQSAAFNKGFAQARGEWLTWLNSDDLYLPGTFKALADLVARKPRAEWISGNKMHFDSATGKILSVNWGPHSLPPMIRGKRAFSAVFGPTTFWRKTLGERMGPIDERLHFAMDSEYWARFTLAGVRQTRLHHLCWAFRDHEESKTAGTQSEETTRERLAETAYWRQKLGYKFPVSWRNPWYLAWCVWRVFDGSWVRRRFLKRKYEGSTVDFLKEYK